ncbi:MAG: hypothetical protein HRT45_05390 [Bdellovibrionales bacterium]|nr:hypothetical protein [Bdellovibrionales bacterium]
MYLFRLLFLVALQCTASAMAQGFVEGTVDYGSSREDDRYKPVSAYMQYDEATGQYAIHRCPVNGQGPVGEVPCTLHFVGTYDEICRIEKSHKRFMTVFTALGSAVLTSIT